METCALAVEVKPSICEALGLFGWDGTKCCKQCHAQGTLRSVRLPDKRRTDACCCSITHLLSEKLAIEVQDDGEFLPV